MQNSVLPPYGAPIARLAVELLTEIWGQVPHAELAKILQVSKGWYNTAIEISSLWKELEFGPDYTLEDLVIAGR
ncbi:hypothetical protein B0H17DRAFT_1206368 [Mycena rosella]|uniref:F-box domain-containing protein n=1 Tax=Mycena rosella TaxID=1033263 RepID=A0AAD7D5A8_MYCRO|nr:hypothetical protein B0H17DRAFT_1206368 [Mycena rosella]